MNKKTFTEIMKELISIRKDEDKLNEALNKFDPDFNHLGFSRYESLVVKSLREAMKDKDDWIGYWLYELSTMKIDKNKAAKIKGKYVPLKTLGNLYDLITN